MARKAYPSDLSDEEWSYLEPLVPAPNPKRMGTPATHSRREIVNAIRYMLRSGCSWRALPHDFPPYTTVHDYFSAWRKSGLWEKINDELTRVMGVKMGKKAEPSALIIDSQTVRTTEKEGLRSGRMQENKGP